MEVAILLNGSLADHAKYLHVYWTRPAIRTDCAPAPAMPTASAEVADQSKATLRLAARLLCIVAAIATLASVQYTPSAQLMLPAATHPHTHATRTPRFLIRQARIRAHTCVARRRLTHAGLSREPCCVHAHVMKVLRVSLLC